MHAAYLLTWNPKRFHWEDLEDDVAQARRDHGYYGNWSCGARRYLDVGSRVFLMRLGEHPKGIVASGWSTSEPYPETHWDLENHAATDAAWYIDLRLNRLEAAPLVGEAELRRLASRLGVKFNWTPEASGVKIPEPLAQALEEMWSGDGSAAADVEATRRHFEGAPSTVKHTHYERDPAARRACIEHHGHACAACGLDFAGLYGEVAAGYIEVHHLVPLSESQEARPINPTSDLVPLCPNCHAVVHMRNPPYSVAEVRGMIEIEARRQDAD